MKTVTIEDIRFELAQADAENLDYRELIQVFLDGCRGYRNFTDEDVIDFYITNNHLLVEDWDDTNPTFEVLQVLDPEGADYYMVYQDHGELNFKLVR